MTKNNALKIVRIQEIDLFFTGKGFSRDFIHVRIIYPLFFISKKTYYTYLGKNAKAVLKNRYNCNWEKELRKHEPIDYNFVMKIMKHYDPLRPDTYPINSEEYRELLKHTKR